MISLCDLFWCDLSSLPKVTVVIRISDDEFDLYTTSTYIFLYMVCSHG